MPVYGNVTQLKNFIQGLNYDYAKYENEGV